MLKYLVTIPNHPPFITNYYSLNFFIKGMTIYNLLSRTFTTDGKTWKDIEEDFLPK